MSIFKIKEESFIIENYTVITEGLLKNIISKLKGKMPASTDEVLKAVELNKKYKAEQIDSLKKWKLDEAKKVIDKKGFVPIKSMNEYEPKTTDDIMNYIKNSKLIECKKVGDFYALIINREVEDEHTKKVHTICTDIFILCRDKDGEIPDRVIGICFWTVGGSLSMVQGNAVGHTTMFTESYNLESTEILNEGIIENIKNIFNFSFLKRKKVVDINKIAKDERDEAIEQLIKKNSLERELKSKGLVLAKSDDPIGKRALSAFRQIVNQEMEEGNRLSLLTFTDNGIEQFSLYSIYNNENGSPIMSNACAYKIKDNTTIDLYLYSVWAAGDLKKDPDCKYGKTIKFAGIKLKEPLKEFCLESALDEINFK